MYIKRTVVGIVIVGLSASMIGCQREPGPMSETEVNPTNTYTQQTKPVETPPVRSQQYSNHRNEKAITPIPDKKFEENMRQKNASLEQTNAIINNSNNRQQIHSKENGVNITEQYHESSNSDKNTSQSELEAVQQAIQAAAPALDNNEE